MTVYAKVYTKDNICEGLPRNAWEHRLMLDPEQPGRVILVEAMWAPLPDGTAAHAYSNTAALDVVRSEYEDAKTQNPEDFPMSFEENFTEMFARLFQYVDEE